jgi:hypothetical protein
MNQLTKTLAVLAVHRSSAVVAERKCVCKRERERGREAEK